MLCGGLRPSFHLVCDLRSTISDEAVYTNFGVGIIFQ